MTSGRQKAVIFKLALDIGRILLYGIKSLPEQRTSEGFFNLQAGEKMRLPAGLTEASDKLILPGLYFLI
jgi:hypothetical protein